MKYYYTFSLDLCYDLRDIKNNNLKLFLENVYEQNFLFGLSDL